MNKSKQKQENIEEKASNIPEGYEKQEDSSFFKFDGIGTSIHGKLMAISESKRYDFKLYTVKDSLTNEMKRFHGTTQLDQLLISAIEGDNIYVELIDEIDTPNGTMKIFDVGVKHK